MTHFIFLGALLLLTSIVLSKTSYRFGVPALLLFLVTGILGGSEGIGGIEFDDYGFAQFIGNVALIFIMFSGGLETKLSTIKPVLREGVILSTLGVLCSVFVVGYFVYLVTDFSFLVSMLIGSIVSSTDAAAVFGVFRSRKMGLKHNLRPLLELESGSNDPMAFIMTTTFIYLIQSPDTSFGMMALMLLQSIVFGTIAGWAFGRAMVWTINKIKLDTDGLYPVLGISLALLAFSATDLIGGNGFLAVYISAVILGNRSFVHKKSLMRFNDGLAWLMQVVMFLMLGLLVYPSHIVPVMGIGIVISLFMIFVARPLVVFVLMALSKFSVRDKIFISWGGLRGAVPIVFATYALVSGLPHAETIFNIVFFISVSSVLIQGTSLPFMARILKLDLPASDANAHPLDYEISESFQSELVETRVEHGSAMVGKKIVELKIPQSVLIILIYRNGKYFAPNGSTVIEENDGLTLMSENDADIGIMTLMCAPVPENDALEKKE